MYKFQTKTFVINSPAGEMDSRIDAWLNSFYVEGLAAMEQPNLKVVGYVSTAAYIVVTIVYWERSI